MIGTIRKHSSWLWWLIAGATIISFVVFMGSGPGRGRGGSGANGSFGTIYGHELTGEEVAQARNDFELYYLVNYGEWPEKSRNITDTQIEQQTYLNLMFAQKAKALGVVVPDDAIADAASQILHSQALARIFGANGGVPMDKFVDGVLRPKGMTAADFEHSVRSQLTVEQLRMTLGLAGSLVSPQEVVQLYDFEHREAYAQAVFFSASNYLSEVTETPAAVGQFFTNNMAYYRQPDRLQVNYVWFNLTNYMDAVKAELAKTNFEEQVNSAYQKNITADEFKNMTPEAAKAKIRQVTIQRRALNDAGVKANEFKKALYAMDPVKPENITVLAKQFGLTARLSEPFAESGESADFANAPNVVRTAFTLSADSPFSDLIVGEDGIYMIGLGNQLPSSVPTFTETRARVEQDFRLQSALALANRAGTNFFVSASVGLAAGQTFAKAAVAAGQTPVILSPFSASSADVPEAGTHADARDLKQAAFSTQPGHVSRFTPTADGGFVLYLQKIESVDASKSAAEITTFTSQIRRGRENEAFNMWVNTEASHEFRNIPALQKLMSPAN
ncbi:MAG TPA: SurA N-terminal domain-containing protein [Verrucomicrobiae bacterium]|nr:SurA N-terminal domain-containing protein [Verrucomicrobiae bacterium]